MDAKELGFKIQELRKQKGMTQEDLAEKTGLSVRTIQRIESGEVDPRSYTLSQIAEALGVNITELTRESESELEKPNKSSTRIWLTLLHLSGFFVLLVPPLIIWILKKDEIPEMDKHGRDVLNFQISMWIYLFAASFSIFLAIGILILPLLGIFSTFVVIINTIRVANGNSYKYPLSIRFIK
jgi:uncharacterized Tic20 family protein